MPGRHGRVAFLLSRLAAVALTPFALAAFAGGVVRVEFSDSAAIEGLYPGEISSVIAPAARALLRAAGHSGRQWNFAMGRVLGSRVLPPPGSGGEGRTRYTVPVLELRRMVAEARAEINADLEAVDGEKFKSAASFRIAYTRLPGSGGDENWRAQGGLPLRVLRVDAGATSEEQVQCRQVAAAASAEALAALQAGGRSDNWLWADKQPAASAFMSSFWSAPVVLWRWYYSASAGQQPDAAHSPTQWADWLGLWGAGASGSGARVQSCAPSELVSLLLPLSLVERALGVWNPHPIVEGMSEQMHCFGP
ncbi:hypothetical protein T492DRAFT_114515 [Pavlovales sp. CCMP2436]|nr:hypothetical protein T492DRAFT_114515 [Pavlovales sp. CCMP2436]